MNYIEKYKKALSRARECMKDGGISQNTIDYLCDIFPELKEKESEDEKIRKELINVINLSYDCCIAITKEKRDKYIAWLEKQGDKVEPKFKVGDWA